MIFLESVLEDSGAGESRVSASSNKNESGLNVGGEKQGNEKGVWNVEDASGNNTEWLNYVKLWIAIVWEN